MGWPAGLKLNKELNIFLGHFFLWLLALWEGKSVLFKCLMFQECLMRLLEVFPYILSGIAPVGFLGASFLISVISDVISLATAHLSLFYSISSKIYRWQVSIIMSLFILFRGASFDFTLADPVRKKKKCDEKTYWFSRVWSRPASFRSFAVFGPGFPFPNSCCLLHALFTCNLFSIISYERHE